MPLSLRYAGKIYENGEPIRGDAGRVTVTTLAARYLAYARRVYVKEGKPTSHTFNIRCAMRLLRDHAGGRLADSYRAPDLARLRDAMITDAKGRKLSLATVNKRLIMVQQAFSWAREYSLVSAETAGDIALVKKLRRGRSEAKDPVLVRAIDRSAVDAILPHLPQVVRDMVELLWIQGCRAQEVCRMRGIEFDETDSEVWLHRPGRYKTQHLALSGQEAVRCIGPKAQEILKRYLTSDPHAFLFSPREAQRQRLAARWEKAGYVRKWDEEFCRQAIERQVAHFAVHFNAHSLRHAIHYGCRDAGIDPWNPNQLRHSRATLMRKQAGIEAARIQLGHSSVATTEIYAEKDLEEARRLALEFG